MMWLRTALGWLGLPSWLLPVVLVSACLSALGAAYLKGRMDSAANCREAQLRAELAALQRDRDAAKEAERASDQMAEALAAANQKLQQEVDVYEKSLALRPDARCRLDDDDLRRLR